MDRKFVFIAIAVALVAVVALAAIAGGGEKKDQGPEVPDTPTVPDVPATIETIGIAILDADGFEIHPTGLKLYQGWNTTLKADVKPSDSTQTVVWSSSNEKAAAVDQSGKVTYKGAGAASIRAESGGYSAECLVTCAEDTLPKSAGYAQMWGVRYLAQYPLSESELVSLLKGYGFSGADASEAARTCGDGYGAPDWDAQCSKACAMAKATGLYDRESASQWLSERGFAGDQITKAISSVYA
ncbi:MAG: Ig-like domain-containing protein [Candidatus Methanomethylophilaceae archaeon]|nr:Ig-like domain-containing protein [Candidatus Methanomethylophilaceae archaeon]